MVIYFDRLINVYFFEWFFVFVESEKKKKKIGGLFIFQLRYL